MQSKWALTFSKHSLKTSALYTPLVATSICQKAVFGLKVLSHAPPCKFANPEVGQGMDWLYFFCPVVCWFPWRQRETEWGWSRQSMLMVLPHTFCLQKAVPQSNRRTKRWQSRRRIWKNGKSAWWRPVLPICLYALCASCLVLRRMCKLLVKSLTTIWSSCCNAVLTLVPNNIVSTCSTPKPQVTLQLVVELLVPPPLLLCCLSQHLQSTVTVKWKAGKTHLKVLSRLLKCLVFAAKQWLGQFTAVNDRASILVLLGPPRSGKTRFALSDVFEPTPFKVDRGDSRDLNIQSRGHRVHSHLVLDNVNSSNFIIRWRRVLMVPPRLCSLTFGWAQPFILVKCLCGWIKPGKAGKKIKFKSLCRTTFVCIWNGKIRQFVVSLQLSWDGGRLPIHCRQRFRAPFDYKTGFGKKSLGEFSR